jgi:Glycosyltransferase Family 4/Glycosyl transferases group 1
VNSRQGAESCGNTSLESRGKKLLYLAVCDPDVPVTGATVRMAAFVSHLGRFYDVTLVNMSGSGHRVAPSIEQRFYDHSNRLGVSRRARVDFSRSGYFLFSPMLYRSADRLLKEEPCHYLLADYGLAAAYGTLLASRHGIPLIYSSHNVEYRMYRDLGKHDLRRQILAPYIYWAERAACRAAKLVITISERDRDEYAKWIPKEKIVVIPQGFEPDVTNPFYDPPPGAPPVILFVGNFRSESNRQAARNIVRAIVPAVTLAMPEARFQLIGADPPRDLAAANVECPGFVDDLGPYFRRANLVIAPMPFAHGMATKMVTALAYGKTVLATPQGAGAISRRYRQLAVAPLESFPGRILELLGTRPSVDGGGFTTLCEEYAWSNLIDRLHRRVEQSCAQPASQAFAEAKVC